MAFIQIPFPAAGAKLANDQIMLIRAAHAARFQDALDRSAGRSVAFEGMPEGAPHKLIAAGCFLVAAGLDGEATAAERAFHVGPDYYRELLESDPTIAEGLIDEGSKALFGRWKPIVSPELAAEIERTYAMSHAWDEMAAAALDFGSDRYATAKARFHALAGGL